MYVHVIEWEGRTCTYFNVLAGEYEGNVGH